MTIRLLLGMESGSTTHSPGAILNLNPALEADLVSTNRATWVTPPVLTADAGKPVQAVMIPDGVVEFSEEVANAIAALGGTSGLQFQATATHLQWKTADTSWANLVSLAEIGGTDFSLIEWQVSATHLQWRFDGVNWVDVIALSALGVTGGGDVGVTDHGALTGLSDDDHGQYHNDTRGDARYYTKAQVDTSLSGKAATSHTHSIGSVVGLQTALDSKQAAITVSATAPASPVEGQLWVQVS